MIDIRPFETLGGADHGWLQAKHHFSFADYFDPARTSWGGLRVWNDDTIAAQTGFPPHPHADMEIITYVREGAITHQDSLGNKGRTEAGDVQVMSAGSGIRHSEYNREPNDTQIFQIWIHPTQRGDKPATGAPGHSSRTTAPGGFVALASSDERDAEALPIRADARVLGATLKAGESPRLPAGRGLVGLTWFPASSAVGDRRRARRRPRWRRDQPGRNPPGHSDRGCGDRLGGRCVGPVRPDGERYNSIT